MRRSFASPSPRRSPVRMLASAGFLALVWLSPAHADTVYLRDGRVVSGRVIEQGDRIFIEHERYGGTIVLRTDVLRIEGDAGAPKAAATTDAVLLKDGRRLVGDVRVTADGAEVVVGLGERGEARHPRSAVLVIQWRDGRAEAAEPAGAGGQLTATIDRRVKELGSTDAALVNEARRELLSLGTFSRAYLQQAAEKQPDLAELKGVLADLDRLEAWRKVLPARAEESVPHLGERLVSRDAREREAVLRAIVLEAPPQAVAPVLLHAIRTDDEPRIRAYGVSQLASLRRYEDLAEVLRMNDGQLRLAAAFALGDAGILAGVPILIEALRLSDLELRSAAIRKLTEYTGQHFGYRAQGSPEDREKSIAQWVAWWNENGNQLVRDSIQDAAPNAEGAKTTAEERDQAAKLWTDANTIIGKAREARPAPAEGGAPPAETPEEAKRRKEQLDRAQELLRQAIKLDPSLSSARLTRAVLLYEDLDRPREAEQMLTKIISRAEQAPDEPVAQAEAAGAKKYALFHLGQIALRDGLWERAHGRFAQAAELDEGFVQAVEAQGDAQLGLALSAPGPDGTPTVAQRKEALAAARQAFTVTLKRLTTLDEELATMSREVVADAVSTAEEGQVIQAVRRSRADLERRTGAVQFKLGRLAAATGDDATALECYRTAARLDGENPTYKDAVATWEKLVPGGGRPAPQTPPGPGPR